MVCFIPDLIKSHDLSSSSLPLAPIFFTNLYASVDNGKERNNNHDTRDDRKLSAFRRATKGCVLVLRTHWCMRRVKKCNVMRS